MTVRISAGIFLLFLSGCSVLHPWATDRDIEGTYEQVFQATLETLKAQQFPIQELDRDEGQIVTGKRPVRGIETHRRVEAVRAQIRPDGDEEADVQLFLIFTDQSGTVRSPEQDDDEADAAAVSNAFSCSAVYDEYLDAIEKRVRELKEGS